LGYRKTAAGGTWHIRQYNPATQRHPKRRFAAADDHLEADGTKVMTFSQAQRWVLEQVHTKTVEAMPGNYIVRQAVTDYIDFLHRHRKSAHDTEVKPAAYVLSTPIAGKRLDDLTPEDLENWLAGALKRRSRRNALADPSERLRRRRSTLNRVIVAFKACLNLAASNGKCRSADAWKRLKKFRGVDSARLRWLTVDETIRLQNAAAPDLHALIAAGLNSGARLGELLALRAGDYDRTSRTLLIADSKSGKPRRIPLTDAGSALFAELTAGKLEDDPLFRRSDGSAWYRVALTRAMRQACEAAKVRPVATFHTLRHTYASHLATAGVPLAFIAEALGHTDTRMVSLHYGHLSPSAVHDAIRAALPAFKSTTAGKVTHIRSRKV